MFVFKASKVNNKYVLLKAYKVLVRKGGVTLEKKLALQCYWHS
jgi:hypothetical protein